MYTLLNHPFRFPLINGSRLCATDPIGKPRLKHLMKGLTSIWLYTGAKSKDIKDISTTFPTTVIAQ